MSSATPPAPAPVETRLAKAVRFLDQGKSVSSDLAPETSIFLASYAMYHAASALLLDRTGEGLKSHADTVEAFSQLVNAEDQGPRFVRALRVSEWLRVIADEDPEGSPTALEAAELKAISREFVAYCRSLL